MYDTNDYQRKVGLQNSNQIKQMTQFLLHCPGGNNNGETRKSEDYLVLLSLHIHSMEWGIKS